MMEYHVELDLSGVIARYRGLPAAIEAGVAAGWERIALEGVRRARAEAPKQESTLLGGIHSVRPNPDTVEIVSGSRYSSYVEGGTGPAAGKPSYMPNPVHLYGYVKARAGVSFRNTKRGSPARSAQYDEIRDRAWALARYIQQHGTKANPYMERTAKYMEKRAPEIMEREISRVAAEVDR